jgi:hypothetical protein
MLLKTVGCFFSVQINIDYLNNEGLYEKTAELNVLFTSHL